MPIYEYKCQTCQHRVELIQKHSDAPLTECPKCHGPMTKLIAAPALQFKGSGFYITDYTNKGKDKDKGKDKSDSGSTEKKSGADKPATESTSSTSAASTDKKTDSGGSSTPPAKSSGDGAT